VGSCADTGSAATLGTDQGDVNGDATAGCVLAGLAGADTTGAMSVGLCRSATPEPTPGPGEEPGADDGSGVAGATASGGNSPGGVLGALASGRLPFTGLPIWAVALAGLALIAVGVALRRMHPRALDARA